MAFINLILVNFLFVFATRTSFYEEIPSDNYNINFKIKNSGTLVSGNFKGLHLKYAFNKNKLGESFFEGELEVISIKTGIEMRDRHLKKSEYFDVTKFPKITLRTTKIELVANDDYKITCDITIKGITQSLVIFSKINYSGSWLTVNSVFDLNRLNFGVGRPSIVMAKNVLVSIEVRLKKNDK